MDFGQSVILFGLVLDALGIAVLSWKPFFMSDEDIQKLSGTYWDENPHVGPRLFSDRRAVRFGTPALLLGFLAQGVGLLL